MNSILCHSNAITMLTLWLMPEMWEDKIVYHEVNEVVKKLSNVSYQLNSREIFLTQVLINGLLEATLLSFNKANDTQKNELLVAIFDIIDFQSDLITDITPRVINA